MKRNPYKPHSFILLLILLLSWTTAFAQRPPQGAMPAHETSLIITSDQKSFWLFIDDVLQNDQPVLSIKLSYIPEGEHYLRVEMSNPEHTTIGQFVQLGPNQNNFRIENTRNLYGLSVGYGVPRTDVTLPYVSLQANQPYGTGPNAPRPTDTGLPNHHKKDGNHAPGNNMDNAPAPLAMSEADFRASLTIIKQEHFETTRLSTAKQLLNSNMLNISQIEQICRLFDFDSNKLDFAKAAFKRCTEKDKYYLLHSVFDFDSSKKALDDYVLQQQ